MTAARLSPKLLRYESEHACPTHAHFCPACGYLHHFAVEAPFRNGARWSWDGNADAPTFTPSMNITVGPFSDGRIKRCHYFLTTGNIQYLGDCTHAMAGQTVPLPDVPKGSLLAAGIIP